MRQILLACQGMCVCVSVDVYVTPCAVIKGFEEAIPEGPESEVQLYAKLAFSYFSLSLLIMDANVRVRRPSVVINIRNSSAKGNTEALAC